MGPYVGADLRFYSPQHQLTLWSHRQWAIHIEVHLVPDNYPQAELTWMAG